MFYNKSVMIERTYLTWSEVMGAKVNEDEFIEIISLFNKFTTLNLLTNINNFLTLSSISNEANSFEIQQILSENLLDLDFRTKANTIIKTTLSQRPVFHRQQILFLMKYVMIYSLNNGGISYEKATTNEKYLLGKVCLITNDFFDIYSQEGFQKTEKTEIEKEHHERINELLAQMLAVTELYNPPDIGKALIRTLDYLQISSEILPDFHNGKTLSDTFKNFNGISIKRYLQMVWGIFLWYQNQTIEDLMENPVNFNLKGNSLFYDLSFPQTEIESFLRLTASTLENFESAIIKEFKNKNLKPQLNFTAFRRFPFIYLKNDVFTCIDISFLIEKTSYGLFYTFLNSFTRDMNDKLFEHWGDVFEIYINRLFREIYPEFSGLFHTDTRFETKSRDKAFDGIKDDVNFLLVMEYKASGLSLEAKYSGNAKLLLEKMDEKYGRYGKGVSQLAKNIEHLFNFEPEKRRKIQGLNSENIKVVYPILILNELSLQFGLANWKLINWFNDEIKTKSIDKKISVKPILVLTVENLENIFLHIDEADFTLLEFVKFYTDFLSDFNNWQSVDLSRMDEYHPMIGARQIFANKFLNEKGISSKANKTLLKELDKFTKEIIELSDKFLEIKSPPNL